MLRDAQLADVSAQLRLDAKENLRLIPKYFNKQSVVDFLDILSDLFTKSRVSRQMEEEINILWASNSQPEEHPLLQLLHCSQKRMGERVPTYKQSL